MKNPDDVIEQVLMALGSTESPAGMEARILRAIETRSEEQASSGLWHGSIASRGEGWLWAGAAALTAACLLAIFTAALHKAGHVAKGGLAVEGTPAGGRLTDAEGVSSRQLLPRSTGVAQARPLDKAARPLSPTKSGAAKSALGTLVWTGPGEANGSDNPTDFDSLAMSEMLAPSKPAPPLPLTYQEKLLVQVVHRGDAEQLAELKPDVRAKQVEIAKAEFHAFFESPPKVKGNE